MTHAAYEEAYAKMIAQNGTFLGLPEIAMLAEREKKNVLLLYYDNDFEDVPTLTPLAQVLFSFTGGALGSADGELSDMASLDTWVLAACRADFVKAPFQQLNHYMPVWTKKQMGSDDFEKTMKHSLAKIDKKILSLNKKLERDSDDSMDEALQESILPHIGWNHRRKAFFQNLEEMGLLPVEVPGDGNCLLWSVVSLLAGPTIRSALSTLQKVEALRLDAWLGKPRCRQLPIVFP